MAEEDVGQMRVERAYFDVACDVVTHIETEQIDPDDKFMLVLAARRLVRGHQMTRKQADLWDKYTVTTE